MRLFADGPGRGVLPLILAAALCACGGSKVSAQSTAPAGNNPSADYPVVLGDPYVVAGTAYEPKDVLNYDEVGYASIDARGEGAISGEHHTLPLPSYVEVTSLDSGRTILVRLERRGPMTGNFLIGLSRQAASQLGIMAGSPVRVRRVNPPEQERAMLRSGLNAPARMDTPVSLVNVLRRKLPNGEGPLPGEQPVEPAPQPSAVARTDSSLSLPTLDAPAPARPAAQTPAVVAPAPVRQAAQTPVIYPAARATTGGRAYVVQAGAFSIRANADRVAAAIGGQISQAGSLYRVRTGPFATRAEAEASLAKVRAAGYSDARIFDGS